MEYLIFDINDEHYAINTQHVIGITENTDVTKIPMLPEHIKGSFEYRNELLMMLDTRIIFGLPTLNTVLADTIEMFNNREKDHINWLKELEDSIKEKRIFTLTKDSHKCAFGKWYYSYKTSDLTIRYILDCFEKPHDIIHSIADKALALAESGKFEEAYAIIKATKEAELHQMIELFTSAKETYTKTIKEITIVVNDNEKTLGLTADRVVSMESIEDNELQTTDEKTLFKNVVFRDEKAIFVLDLEKMFSSFL